MNASAAWLAAMDGERVDLLSSFGAERELFVELGCGKGAFVTGLSERYPSAALLAVEKVTDVAMMAMEKADRAGCKNVRFLIRRPALPSMHFCRGMRHASISQFQRSLAEKAHAEKTIDQPAFFGTL